MAPKTYIREGLDEDRHVLHPALAARAEVDRLRAPALEQPPRRLDYGFVQLVVARGADVILGCDEHLGPQGTIRSLDHRRDRSRRLLC